MQYRTTRGIQYEDVAQAADALLQEGVRPTIERIRMQIGRGSPNTVSPMLEQWFAGLGARLAGTGGPVPANGLPDAVTKAATALWNTACEQAQAQAQAEWLARRAAVDAEAVQITEARAQLEAREMALHERLRSMGEALQHTTQQLDESNERYKSAQRALEARSEEAAAQRATAARLTEQYATLEQRLGAAQRQMQDERTALEERHTLSERRWLEEVDRARQETRKSTLLVHENARKVTHLQSALDAAQATHQAAALAQEQQINRLREALASAEGQVVQGQQLLSQLQHSTLLASNAAPRTRQLGARSARTPAPSRQKLGKNRF